MANKEIKSFKCELVSWSSVARLSKKLANKIRNAGYSPDIVIAIARGGYVPARLVCDHLDIYNLTSIRIAHYTGGSTKLDAARLSVPLSVDIKNMKVLLVDDIDDTGDTFKLALEHLWAFQPAAIKVAVLHHKTVSTLLPDFYATTVRKWRWIVYPWALIEDVSSFVRELLPAVKTMDEINIRLKRDYGIALPVKTLEKIYQSVLAGNTNGPGTIGMTKD